jgi:hypothetical protein
MTESRHQSEADVMYESKDLTNMHFGQLNYTTDGSSSKQLSVRNSSSNSHSLGNRFKIKSDSPVFKNRINSKFMDGAGTKEVIPEEATTSSNQTKPGSLSRERANQLGLGNMIPNQIDNTFQPRASEGVQVTTANN